MSIALLLLSTTLQKEKGLAHILSNHKCFEKNKNYFQKVFRGMVFQFFNTPFGVKNITIACTYAFRCKK